MLGAGGWGCGAILATFSGILDTTKRIPGPCRANEALKGLQVSSFHLEMGLGGVLLTPEEPARQGRQPDEEVSGVAVRTADRSPEWARMGRWREWGGLEATGAKARAQGAWGSGCWCRRISTVVAATEKSVAWAMQVHSSLEDRILP